jgi:hypothetical protein
MNKEIFEKELKLIEEWWSSELDIEVSGNCKNKILIFGCDNDSYFDHKNNKWIFSGFRVLVPADIKMHPEYKDWMLYLYDKDLLWKKYSLEEALELYKEYMTDCEVDVSDIDKDVIDEFKQAFNLF